MPDDETWNNYKVELSIVTEADSPESALDDVLSSKWTWTVTNLDTNESVELRG